MELIPDTLPKSWEGLFSDLEEFNGIIETLKEHMRFKDYTRFIPERNNLYRALELTPVDKVRVVILGQDPYHQKCDCGKHDRAQGLSFSVAKCDSIPVSLKNIFKEIKSCYPNITMPDHGDLTNWAKQGVLLLNTALTVQPDEPGSHGKVWYSIIQKIANMIKIHNPKCIYLLWGKEAQSFSTFLPGNAIKMESSHPSGFSCHRGFLGCGHFKKVNDILCKKDCKGGEGCKCIDWSLN